MLLGVGLALRLYAIHEKIHLPVLLRDSAPPTASSLEMQSVFGLLNQSSCRDWVERGVSPRNICEKTVAVHKFRVTPRCQGIKLG